MLEADIGEIKVTNVLYSPSIKRNLLSVGSLADIGKVIVFTKKHVYMLDSLIKGNILARGHRDNSNGLYYFGDIVLTKDQTNYVSTSSFTNQANYILVEEQAKQWHRRFGHLSYKGLYHLVKEDQIEGMPSIPNAQEICETCLARKQHRHRAPKESASRANNVNDLVHADLMGPMKTKSLNGSRYVAVFTDDMSRKSFVYFLRSKDEALKKFKLYVARTKQKLVEK